MAMKKNLWIVLVTIMVVVSSQLSFVHSRVLRSEALKAQVGDNREGFKGAESSPGMASLVVSSNNMSTRPSKRSLAFKLASGPSRKGPGH